MQLWALVFEGDWSVTDYAAYGNRVAWQMTEMPQYPDLSESDYQRRWRELDRAVLAKAVPVNATPETIVGDLAANTYDAAKACGLANTEDPYRDGPFDHYGHQFDHYSQFGGVWLASAVTDRRLNDGSTVAEAGLTDGDLIVLCVARHTGIGYMLGPASHPDKLFQNLQLVANVQRMATPKLWGVLLYTDGDAELAIYVRTHFDELNALSGPLLGIFVVERPQSWASAKHYWQQHLDPPLLRMFSAMRWLSWKPYDRHLCYEIARELGVLPSQLPCLVIFRGADPTGTLIFPIELASHAYLRGLFGEIERTIGQDSRSYNVEEALERSRYHGQRYSDLNALADRPQDVISTMKSTKVVDDAAFDRLASAQRRILDELRRHRSPGVTTYEFRGYNVFTHEGDHPMTENFNFHGQTTFINRPVNTIIQDFQRVYAPSPEREQLAELLRLVLTSASLRDAEKEQAAEDIHRVARELAAAKPDKESVKSKLTTLQNALSKAVDIAKPALTITAELIKIFTG